MTAELLCPEEIDTRLNWPPGTAGRLARRCLLAHYQLPDGALRFAWHEVEALVRHILPQEQEVVHHAD